MLSPKVGLENPDLGTSGNVSATLCVRVKRGLVVGAQPQTRSPGPRFHFHSDARAEGFFRAYGLLHLREHRFDADRILAFADKDEVRCQQPRSASPERRRLGL